MKINQKYLKELLEAFQSAEKPMTDIVELKGKGFDIDSDEFAFHSDILIDKCLIETVTTNTESLGAGYQLLGAGLRVWHEIPLRLTASGHDFIDSLNEPDVWETIQKEFKESSLDTLKFVAKNLAKEFAKNKIKKLIE